MKDIKYSKCAKKGHWIQKILDSSRFRVMAGWTVGIGLMTYGAILLEKHLHFDGILLAFLGIVAFMTAPCLFAVLNEEQYQSYEDYQEYTSKQEYERREKGEREMVNIKPSQTPPMPEVKPPKVPPTDFEKFKELLTEVGCEYTIWLNPDDVSIEISGDLSVEFDRQGKFKGFVTG